MSINNKDVVVLIGAGGIGLAIARRISSGKHIVVAGLDNQQLDDAVSTLHDNGFDVTKQPVDVSSRTSIQELVKVAQSAGNGKITRVIMAAGVSPSQAPIDMIVKVDLYGTAVVLEEFGEVIAEGGSGVVISSQSSFRYGNMSPEDSEALAMAPTEELLDLPIVKSIDNTLTAYQVAKRGNALRVMAEVTKWSKRNARINTISPGIIITKLAWDELNGPRGENYRNMLELMPAHRAGTVDEIAELANFIMGENGGFITGSDFLIDGGSTAGYWYGDLQYMQNAMGGNTK